MATKRLTERFAAPLSGGQVDRANGVIRDVLVCGTTSANGRSYPWGKGLTCDPKRYEGKTVNADHGQQATIDRKLGWLANVTVAADGRPRADLHLLTSHPMAARVFEAAERNPALFGLSHVAVCRTRMEAGVEVIESVESVESVDLVADPATTKGFFEGRTVPTTLRKFLESVATAKHAPRCKKWAKAKRLAEMDAMPMDLPPPPAADAAEPDADDGISAAFKTALDAVCADLLANSGDPAKVKELVAKIKKLAAAHGDINGDGKVDAADVDAADDSDGGDDKPAMESVLSAVETLTAGGLKVTRESLGLVARLSAADRPALMTLLAESGGEKARTGGRQTVPVEETKPADGKTVAESKAAVSAFVRS